MSEGWALFFLWAFLTSLYVLFVLYARTYVALQRARETLASEVAYLTWIRDSDNAYIRQLERRIQNQRAQLRRWQDNYTRITFNGEMQDEERAKEQK